MALFSSFINAKTILFRCVLWCFRSALFMGPPRRQINPSMASSSSSLDSTPPSSSQSKKYDVFLSFRGEDTRNTFVDHLYSALEKQGIETFKDDEKLPRGEKIHSSLLNAIEDSQIAVVVFSENYANSSWCLQELEHIMKCKDERGQTVIPIFYHIDPSEVRKQKRKYGEAFAKYEAKKKSVWRKALFDAGSLSGLVAEGPETRFIRKIVSTISERLCMAIQIDDEDLVGIQDRLQALKSMLAIDSQGVLMVGIWGLGGSGKTTLAYAAYNEISSKFDGCCFLKNVREESSKRDLKELQKEILSHILGQEKEQLLGDVRILIKTRLRRKKVLLVLDDVDDADQLEGLAGSHNWFKEGSRIIITTRDQHLLNIQQVNVIYNISLLNNDEAMKLFCKHALSRGKRIEEYHILSNKVVSYARGLPLALKVMGSLLCDKDKSEWVSALARLKDIPEDDIMETLKVSYDGLKPLEQELFLDIACFFRFFKYDPWMILDACGLHPKIGVAKLKEKALITVSEEGFFDMHDLIQEMGHYIVRKENPRNPEKQSRVWRFEDVKKICDIPTEENHVEALCLHWEEVPDNFPCAVANMKKLRSISCHKFPATSLSRNFQSTNLCYLRLESSRLKQLWEGDKNLPNLKVLDLRYSEELQSTPNFLGLPCLERIILIGCIKLIDVHPSISNHETLISVDMTGCDSLASFPPISGMKKLETLKLSCHQLHKFPEIKMNMENLVTLSLVGTGIQVVPSSIEQYCTNLITLNVQLSANLQSIEGLPSSLMELYLGSCRLTNGDILSALYELPNLQVLILRFNCFSRLHRSLLQLRSLKVLDLSNGFNLVELPDLPESIAVLKADYCDKLGIVDLPTNLRWLWRISLPMKSISGDVHRKVQSMLQGNAIKDYSISLLFHDNGKTIREIAGTLMLELPWNWCNEFSGFLIRINFDHAGELFPGVITIKDVINNESEDGTSNTTREAVCYLYISFGSLRHTSWWKSKHTTISFSVAILFSSLQVELVPGRIKGDSLERVRDTTNSLEFWNTEPIKIIRDSESCIEIEWDHGINIV